MIVRQKEGESLHDILTHFRLELAKIPNFIDELAINYLAAGINQTRHGLHENFLIKSTKPKSIDANPRALTYRP